MTLSLARPRSTDAFLDLAGDFLVAREACSIDSGSLGIVYTYI